MRQADAFDSTPHHENLATILRHAPHLASMLSITDERIAIVVAFLSFLQQIALLLWKFLG